MSDKRIPLIAGLLVLLVVGLLIGLALVSPDRRQDNTPRVSVQAEDDETREQDNDRDTPPRRAPRSEPGDASETDTGEEKQPVVEKPVIKVEVKASVSGIALDWADDPVPGVVVTLLSAENNSTTGPTTGTDEDGNFVFDANLNEGETYFVACLEEGKAITATSSFTVRKEEPTEGLVLKVYDEARVYGRVMDGNADEPLEGVTIKMEGRRDERADRLGRLLGRLRPVVTDDDGTFEMGGIAPGKYLFRAEKSGWMANAFSPNTRAVQEAELDEYANFELMDFILIQAGVIEGRVLKRSDQTAIPGATVDLGTVLGGSYGTTVTDETGYYRFDSVPPGFGGQEGPGAGVGGIAVRATAPGYAIATRDLRVRSGQTRSNIDLLLDDGASVNGTVYDDKMQPLAGARVYYNDNDFLRGGEMVAGIAIPERTISTVTGEDGTFTLSNLPVGEVTITGAADGFANTDRQLMLVAGESMQVDINLKPAGFIEGTVTNEYGEPVAGVPLAAYDAGGPNQLSFIMKSFFGETLPDRGESEMFPASIRTDEDGYYRIDNLKPTKYVVLANSREYEKYASPELDVKAGATVVHDIQLKVGGTIFGRVYDAYENPVSGAAVTCASLQGQEQLRIRTAYTDSNGNYEITGLAEGTYTVLRNDGDLTQFMLPNPSNQVTVKSGQRVEFDIYSQRPGTARIYGRVTLDGRPYAEESLVLAGGGFKGFAANTTRTDADGNYEFRNVPLGTYQIAQSGGRMPSLVRKRVRVDREGDIEFNIDYVTVTLSGRVEMEGGEVPEGRIRVIASPVSPTGQDSMGDDEEVNDLEMMIFQEATADRETGAFEITGLSPGFYRLTVRSENNGMVTRPYLNLRASVGGIVMTLPREGATIQGTVVGLDEAEANTPFGLIGALTIEDESGNPIALGGFDNGVNLGDSKEFTVENLGTGTYTITLSLPGYTPATHNNVKLTAGETVELVFEFESSGNARIVLQNDDLDLASAFELEYEIINSKGEVFKKRFTFLDFFDSEGNTTQDGEDNAFVIKDLPPETYTITLELPGYRKAEETFTVVAGETADVPVEFTPE